MLPFAPRGAVAAILLLGTGCGPEAGSRPERTTSESAVPPSASPADSLALTTPDGVEVWYSLARTGQGPHGSSCTERGLEIRRAGQRIRVPLLYTGETPTLLNDSTIRAVLWTNCQPGDAYLVDLMSGRPVRQTKAGQ